MLDFASPCLDVYMRMAKDLGVSPEGSVIVGESHRSDHDGARAAGMASVRLWRSSEGRADRSIKSLRELPEEIRLK
jgi:FMN phosphatase YigB (HAD superfamily)